MNPVKNTTLIEAVAMAIQYEKDCFDFYLKNFENSKEGSSVKEFFQQLAEDVDEHIKLIQDIYNELSGGVQFPNLKQLGEIHKFHSTAIFKVMKKIERNVSKAVSDDQDKIEKAMRSAEDARDFYNKMKDKFPAPDIKLLFKRLADYNEENRLMMEAQYGFLTQKDKADYYWEDEDLVKQANK